MNLQAITASSVGTVTPFVPGTWKRSSGYTTAADGTQVPDYAADVVLPMQVQALTNKDLKQMDGLNIQGVKRAVYMQGNVQGVSSAQGIGGDLLVFGSGPSVPPDLAGSTWLVVTVLETWGVGWCKVAVALQAPDGDT